MVEVSEDVVVEAPVEEVFAFMDDSTNHVTVTPSLTEVRHLEPVDGRKRLEYTFRMAGVPLAGELVEVGREPGVRLHFELRGQLEGDIVLDFEAVEAGTRLTYTCRYDIPGCVLETVATPFVCRYNERELATTLGNVKTHIETDSS